MGTDRVLDLEGGEVDIALRYARQPLDGLPATEVARDSYIVVASPSLIGDASGMFDPRALAGLPLIDAQWSREFKNPPMWREWCRLARDHYGDVPDLTRSISMSFLEDLHGIEAAIAGQGVALCSDLLVAGALARGELRQISPLRFPGYSVYAAHRPGDPRLAEIAIFEGWIASAFGAGLKRVQPFACARKSWKALR